MYGRINLYDEIVMAVASAQGQNYQRIDYAIKAG
jgi:hypothetical protein